MATLGARKDIRYNTLKAIYQVLGGPFKGGKPQSPKLNAIIKDIVDKIFRA